MISSIPQFIGGKSRNLEKLIRYLSGIVISTFKVATIGQFAALSFPGCAAFFPTTFLCSNDLPCEELLLVLWISSL